MATSKTTDRSDLLFQQGSCKILLKQGDLFDQKDVEVIVVPTPGVDETDPDSFVVFKSFKSKANNYFTKEAERIRPSLKSHRPEIAFRNGHGYIFVIPPYLHKPDVAHDLLKKNYSSSLKLAIEHNIRSIAFPTIGCGGRRFNTQDAARVVFTAFEEVLSSKEGKKMEKIQIIIYSDTVWEDFSQAFMDQALDTKSKIKFVEPVSKAASSPGTSQRESQDDQAKDYPDDFESPNQTQQNQKKKISTRLDPDAPSFQSKQSNQRRDLRRFYINNNKTELHILQGDILQTKVDAIVNAANESMSGGSGVDGAIHSAAGSELLKACKQHKEIYPDVRLPTGRSRILLSYKMSRTTHYIINTAGPRYDDFTADECKEKLTSCYKTSLALANLYDLETVACTAISCGIFGYPIDEGAEVALATVNVEAGSMKRIFFILKDDEIYDAWVKAARKLGLQSMDQTAPDQATTAKQPKSSASPPKSPEKPQAKSQSDERQPSQGPKVTDASTPEDRKDSDPPLRESVAEQPSSNEEEDEKSNAQKSETNENEQLSTSSTNTIDHDQSVPVVHRNATGSIISSGRGRGRDLNRKNF